MGIKIKSNLLALNIIAFTLELGGLVLVGWCTRPLVALGVFAIIWAINIKNVIKEAEKRLTVASIKEKYGVK